MKKALAWAMCLAWMAVIFAFSAMPGDVSGAQSGRITALVMRLLSLLPGERFAASAATVEWIVRKGAHMTEYAVLFLLYHRALRLSGVRRCGLLALALCAAYATTDELHQCITPERGPSPVDVMIDTAGAAIAGILHALWCATSRGGGRPRRG